MTSLFKFEDYIDLDNQDNSDFSTEDLPSDRATNPIWTSLSPPGTPTDPKDWLSLVNYNDDSTFPSIRELSWPTDSPAFYPQDLLLKQDWTLPLQSSSIMLSTDDPVLSAPHEFCAKGMKPLASDGKTGACDIKNPPDYVTANTTSSMATLTPEQQLAQCGHDLAGIEPSTLALRNSKKPRNGKRNAEALEPIQEGAHSGEAKQPTRPKRKKTRRQNVYCICQQPDTGEAMVQCDQCDKWYHCRCMFLDLDKASSLDTWKCSTCDTNAATAAKGTSSLLPLEMASTSLNPSKPLRRSLRQTTKGKHHRM